MAIIRRYDKWGDYVFVACKTHQNQPILVKSGQRLVEAFAYTESVLDFQIEAWVVLPDHFHAVLALGRTSAADVMKRIKEKFARSYRSGRGLRSGRVWQHRYWDHILRSEHDWRHHVAYIHWNPVKHGYAKDPFVWKLSSIHEWCEVESRYRLRPNAEKEYGYGE